HFEHGIVEVGNVRVLDTSYQLICDCRVVLGKLRAAPALFDEADPSTSVLRLPLDDRAIRSALWTCARATTVAVPALHRAAHPDAGADELTGRSVGEAARDAVLTVAVIEVALTHPVLGCKPENKAE